MQHDKSYLLHLFAGCCNSYVFARTCHCLKICVPTWVIFQSRHTRRHAHVFVLQIEDNEIYENAQSGIEISEAANPEVTRIVIAHNIYMLIQDTQNSALLHGTSDACSSIFATQTYVLIPNISIGPDASMLPGG